ncbi:rho GTPase-activating protein 39 [Hyposmocoma kahamanoa]|uniref:rho GTPase-activating protein 39 n=1 Tax=Hyposmocoma kahamanoa TaxID=1477025 RepID=UPI000E6D98E1|nr:rho GTPase-activating protein 39 [Hyposmocoma kahamanoa]
MSSERVEWVEIIEPKTKEHMYANLTTGECVWDPPEGVKVKRTDSSQWWELFDINTHRFYYYNASTQTTVWHRPTDCDIIPLAKLQTLKQNTDPQKRRETSTQTNQAAPQVPLDLVSSNGNSTLASASKLSPSNAKNVTLTQTSPVRTRRSHYHHRNSGESRRGRLSEDGTSQLCRHTDSGRSSDSSISSAQRRKQELNAAACNAPICTPQLKKRSSAVTPHEREGEKWSPHSGLNRSGSFISPRKDASDDSMHEKYFKSVESTPLTRRKLKQQSAGGSSCESASPQSPSSPLQKPQPTPFLQTSAARPSLVSSISLATDAAGGGSRVMHSLERPHQLSRHARERYSDRHLDKDRIAELERMDRYPEKQAVYSVDKPFRQTSLDLRHNPASSNWQPSREFTRRQQAEPERYSSSKTSISSGSSKHRTPPHEPHHNFMRLASSDQDNMAAVNYKMKCVTMEPPLTEPNVQKHNQRLESTSTPKDRTKSRRHKRPVELEEPHLDDEEEDEDGRTSPLYSNWDLRGMQHLLPLQDYIIQQAKLSSRGRYGNGSGSDGESASSRSRSRSGSESRSLSGHEPDNESSDGGARTPDDDDGSGVYLPHSYGHTRPQDVEYMNHGVAYYNTFVGFDRDRPPSPGIHRVGKWPIHVQVSHYAGVACKRLERIGFGGKKQPRKPTTEDIDQARIQIFRQSMFGNTLSEVMALQKDRFPNRQLPWVQVALSQQILALSGRETEGIFRVSADVDEVNALKAKIDNWELPDASTLTDAHAPASLLKLWYRELYEPLIPDHLYGACIAAGSDFAVCTRALQRLPHINRMVLTYLIQFLQQFTAPEVVSQTKMDSANLAMVFAPNCLRCTSQDPRVILENARKEMTFLKTLITNLDTSHVQDLL